MLRYSIIFSLFFCFVFAQKNTPSLSKRQRLAQERIYLQNLIKKNSANLNYSQQQEDVTVEKLNQLNEQIEHRATLISNITKEVGTITDDISSSSSQIQESEQEINRLKKEYIVMIQYAFKNRMYYSDIMFVFAADDFRQAYKRLKYISQHTEARKKKVLAIKGLKERLMTKNSTLKNDLLSKQGLIQEQEIQRVAMEQELAQQESWLKLLEVTNKALKKELDAKVEHAKYIENEINKIVSQELNYLYKGINIENERPNSVAFEKMKGKLPNPLKSSTVGLGFGRSKNAINPALVTDNNGVDLVAGLNSKVSCVYTGYVVKIITLPTKQKAVFVRHGQYFSIYSNLKEVSVKEGQKLSSQQIIGTAGANIQQNQSELHFELWNNKQKYNPEAWLVIINE